MMSVVIALRLAETILMVSAVANVALVWRHGSWRVFFAWLWLWIVYEVCIYLRALS